MKYRKKQVIIEAIQFDGTNGEEIEEFTNCAARRLATHTPLMIISTLEGDYQARTGDWIIKGVKGEFYPCKPDIFALTYEHPDDVEKEIKEHIYLAYVMYKLSDFKYEVYASKSLEWDIKKKAPMSIDAHKLFVDVIKKRKPELYDPRKTTNEIMKIVEDYLFKNAQNTSTPK